MPKEVRSVSSTGGVKRTKRARFDLIPPRAMRLLAEHFGRGALKYADNNWRKGYEWSKSISALERHLNAYKENEEYDSCPEDGDGCSFVDAEGNPFTTDEPGTCFNHTGSLHLIAVMWHAAALTESFFDHPEFDDRWKGAPKKTEEEDVDSTEKMLEKVAVDTKDVGSGMRPNAYGPHISIVPGSMTITNPSPNRDDLYAAQQLRRAMQEAAELRAR